LAIGIVAAVILGFIWHPVFNWFIKLVKGQSDDKSRTNYAMQFFTALILVATAQGLGGLLSVIPIPFIRLLGPLLLTVGSLLSLFVAYSWFKFFRVHKYVEYVLLVLMALTVLGTGFGFVSGLVSEISNLGSGSSGSVGDVEISDEARQAFEASIEAAKAGGATDEQIEQMRKGFEESAKVAAAAIAAAAKAADDVKDDVKDDDENADDENADDDDAAKGEEAKPVAAAKHDNSKNDKTVAAATKEDDDTAAAKEDNDTAADDSNDEPVPSGRSLMNKPARPRASTDYLEFAAKREEIETALRSKPSLLNNKDVRKLYEAVLKDTYKAEKTSSKKKTEAWEKDLNERLRDLEVYKATNKSVVRLHQRIFGK
jgi:hypothetical protein